MKIFAKILVKIGIDKMSETRWGGVEFRDENEWRNNVSFIAVSSVLNDVKYFLNFIIYV